MVGKHIIKPNIHSYTPCYDPPIPVEEVEPPIHTPNPQPIYQDPLDRFEDIAFTISEDLEIYPI